MRAVMFTRKLPLRRFFKLLLFLLLILVTLTGALFGVQNGVNYSHVKMSFYTLSLPSMLIAIVYFSRFTTTKLTMKNCAFAALFTFYVSFVGGGYIYLVNSIGVHPPVLISGPVLTKDQFKGKYKPSFYITFKDSASEEIMEVELNSYQYNKLKIGDIYSETMYIGTLGLLYRQKT